MKTTTGHKMLRLGPAGRRLVESVESTAEGRRLHARTEAMFDAVFPLVEIMREQGVTHRELARRLGVSRQRVGQILGCDKNLTVETLSDAYHVLGHRLVVGCEPILASKRGRARAR